MPPLDKEALDELMRQPEEEIKFDDFGQAVNPLSAVHEAIEEDVSEATEIHRIGADAIQYAAEAQAIGTQLELASQVSVGANSVMNSSPIRSSRRARTKGKIDK